MNSYDNPYNMSVHKFGDGGKMFCNHYTCPECKVSWDDVWSAACNDRCPECDKEIEPEESEDIVNDDETCMKIYQIINKAVGVIHHGELGDLVFVGFDSFKKSFTDVFSIKTRSGETFTFNNESIRNARRKQIKIGQMFFEGMIMYSNDDTLMEFVLLQPMPLRNQVSV